MVDVWPLFKTETTLDCIGFPAKSVITMVYLPAFCPSNKILNSDPVTGLGKIFASLTVVKGIKDFKDSYSGAKDSEDPEKKNENEQKNKI